MITKKEALSFLQEHQPMPKDNELTQVIINKYDEVRGFFINNPDNYENDFIEAHIQWID